MGSPAAAPLTAAQEWKSHWLLVLSATVGLSYLTAPNYSLGLFMEPVTKEFGWGRAQFSIGTMIAAVVAVFLSPWIGMAIDRYGVRRIAIPGMVATILCFASFSLATGSFPQWILLWVLYSFIALSIKSTVWTVAVAGTFDKGRSLALALTLCGTAITQIAAPPVAQWLIDDFGWRSAYWMMSFGWGGLALILCLFFLYDARDRLRLSPTKTAAIVRRGLTLKQAVRNPALIKIGISTVLTMTLGLAMLVHQVPILTETGVSRQNAAYLASLGGLAGIFGKLITGWLMDHFDAGRIGGITLLISAAAFILLLEHFATPFTVVFAMVMIGYASGCKLQICAYLTSRYAGMAHYGAIFGVMSSLIAVGGGLGPTLAGLTYDMAGSYSPLIYMAVIGTIIAGLLLFGLGEQPDWDAPEPDENNVTASA